MTWFRVDDSFYDHPKVADLPDSALALWIRAGAYCARHLTDGAIAIRTARRMCDDPDGAIEALIKSGLWIRDGDGYRFHDWHIYQPTAAEARATRDARSIGGAIGNHDRWHTKRGKFDPSCTYCRVKDRTTDRVPDRTTDRVPDRKTIAGGESHANPPSRPVPTRPDPVSSKSKTGGVDLRTDMSREDHLPDVPKPADDVDESELPARLRKRKVWCDEHGQPNDRECMYCRADHGDPAYHAKRRDRGET